MKYVAIIEFIATICQKNKNQLAVLESIKVCTDFLPDKLVLKGLKDRYADLALVYLSEMKFFNATKILF